MVIKKKEELNNLIVALSIFYIIIFPLGQLIRLERVIFGNYIVIQPIEVVSLFLTFIAFRNIKNIFIKYESYFTFLIALIFSLLISIGRYEFKTLVSSIFYLIRFLSFIGVFYGCFVLRWSLGKKFMERVIHFVGLSILTFGWIQYIYFPDLRILRYFGWDNHIYRLASTFLDPGFTGILLTLFSLFLTQKYFKTRKKIYLFSTAATVIGVFFTYSRSSYLALISGMVFLARIKKISFEKLLMWGLPILIIVIIFLPRPGGEGIRLERTASIFARIENYREVYNIWKSSPVFGIGFNNLCAYRLQKNPDAHFDSHACSGADSSLMMILATSGIIGIVSFFRFVITSIDKTNPNKNYKLVYSQILALIVHSVFTNSLFYPWVVGLIALNVSYVSKKGF